MASTRRLYESSSGVLVTSAEDFCLCVRQELAQATLSQKRYPIELLIDCVVVTNHEVEIRYGISMTPKSEYVHFCHLRKDYFNPAPPHQARIRCGAVIGVARQSR